MRKRSDVQAAADPRQTAIPGTETPKAVPDPPPSSPRPKSSTSSAPDHVTVDNGIVFIKCIDCGLNQSAATGKLVEMPNGKKLLHCVRCNGLLDPDEELTPEFLEKLKAQSGKAATPAPAQPPPKAAAPAPKPTPAQSAPNTSGPKCVKCGVTMTQTSSGLFAPCGHPQTTTAPSATPVTGAEGETVTACYGEEKFSPRQYQSFGIGPFFRTTRLQPGENASQALARASSELRTFAQIEFEQKAKDFLSKLEWLDAKLGGGK